MIHSVTDNIIFILKSRIFTFTHIVILAKDSGSYLPNANTQKTIVIRKTTSHTLLGPSRVRSFPVYSPYWTPRVLAETKSVYDPCVETTAAPPVWEGVGNDGWTTQSRRGRVESEPVRVRPPRTWRTLARPVAKGPTGSLLGQGPQLLL